MNTMNILKILTEYVPEKYRRYLPLAGLIVLGIIALFGSRYLTPELQGEIKTAIQTTIAVTPEVTPLP